MTKTSLALLIGCTLSSWNLDADACSPPHRERPALKIEALETQEIPRNGAIVVRTNRLVSLQGEESGATKSEISCTVRSGEKELSGSLKNWPEGGFPKIPRVAWIPAAPLPENAELEFACTDNTLKTELIRSTVKTNASSAPDVTVGAISVHVEERGRDITECTSNGTCGGDCEVVGTEYHKWAVITVPQPSGGFTVGGYELVARIDPSSVNYPFYPATVDKGATSSAYNTFTEDGNLKVQVFLPPSDTAYTPCYTIDVNSLSGSVRSQPVCLASGKYEERTVDDGACSIGGTSGSGNAWYVVGVLALTALMRRRKSPAPVPALPCGFGRH